MSLKIVSSSRNGDDLSNFFEILEGVGTDNSFQTEFFLGPDISKDGEDDIVTKLCDFML